MKIFKKPYSIIAVDSKNQQIFLTKIESTVKLMKLVLQLYRFLPRAWGDSSNLFA